MASISRGRFLLGAVPTCKILRSLCVEGPRTRFKLRGDRVGDHMDLFRRTACVTNNLLLDLTRSHLVAFHGQPRGSLEISTIIIAIASS